MPKFKSNREDVRLSESMISLMLLGNDSVDSSQRISTLASASSTPHSLTSQRWKNEFIKLVNYEGITSVLRQCDCALDSRFHVPDTIISSYASAYSSLTHKKFLRNQLLNLKLHCKCKSCEKYGHWAVDHNPNGSMPAGVSSNDEWYVNRPLTAQADGIRLKWPILKDPISHPIPTVASVIMIKTRDVSR